MSLGGIGKSILKGAKYAGLSVGVSALVGVSADLPQVIGEAVIKAGGPEFLAVLLGTYAVPGLGGALAVAIQQLIAHRDKIFVPGK